MNEVLVHSDLAASDPKSLREVFSSTSPSREPEREVVLHVKRVGKCYRLYDRPEDRLKHLLAPSLRRWLGRFGPNTEYGREFWALKGIDFELRRGEAMAIIGRNGAGKSTLLQIIAGTLAPTVGEYHVSGRIAALLELGSGFNPDFTGRENVFMNASILGLTHAEIGRKFDEIASFADIGDFIDQPVRTYSTGMLVRLAFAVQTAVSPEILIVDEALAVGDVFFQAKCMALLRKLLSDGVTLLFVSHDMGTVRQLCSRALLLDRGEQLAYGDAANVADQYMRMEFEERNRRAEIPKERSQVPSVDLEELGGDAKANKESEFLSETTASDVVDYFGGLSHFREKAKYNRSGNGEARFVNVQLMNRGRLCDLFEFGDTLVLRQIVQFNRKLSNVNVAYKIRTLQGTDVVFGDTRLCEAMNREYLPGRLYVFDWSIKLPLMHGPYCVLSGLTVPPLVPGSDWTFLDMVPLCADFRVAPRKAGMVDGFVVLDADLDVQVIPQTLYATLTEPRR